MLCGKCQVFGLSVEAFRSSPFKEQRMHQLGKFAEISSRIDCSLCQFLSRSFLQGPVPSDDLKGSRVQGNWREIARGSLNACLSMYLCRNDEEPNKVQFDLRIVTDDNAPFFGSGRLIKKPFINPDLVKSWIHRCRTTHSCDKARSSNLPPGFMVIDIMEKRLVTVTSQCRYVALSYVWGDSVKFETDSHNVDQLRQVNGIHNIWQQLNKTIQSAISFTDSLGERYIWIDSLCIIQHNGENAQANIEAMDAIYQKALFVIAAADNRSVIEGLHGVVIPRKPLQHEAVILPGLRVLGVFSYLSYMEQSIYDTRAWTYAGNSKAQ